MQKKRIALLQSLESQFISFLLPWGCRGMHMLGPGRPIRVGFLENFNRANPFGPR